MKKQKELPHYDMTETIYNNIVNPELEQINRAARDLIRVSNVKEKNSILIGLVTELINGDAVDIKVIEQSIKRKRKE